MVRNALRRELTELLTVPQGSRRPVIRRSLQEMWLYATDVPLLFEGSVLEHMLHALAGAGWAYEQDGYWMQLRKTAQEPPEDWYTGTFGPEAACCLSLLERHQGSGGEPSEKVQYMLIKAGEEGEKAYEEACAAIHREWAERLRKGNSIPEISRRYFRA